MVGPLFAAAPYEVSKGVRRRGKHAGKRRAQSAHPFAVRWSAPKVQAVESLSPSRPDHCRKRPEWIATFATDTPVLATGFGLHGPLLSAEFRAQHILNGSVVQQCRDALTFKLADAACFGAKALDFAAPPGFVGYSGGQADNAFYRPILRSGEHLLLAAQLPVIAV